jgi:hypothetical protein
MSEKYRIYQLYPKQKILDKRSPDGVLRKDWYSHPELGECLFKEARSAEWTISDGRDARADWSEKVVNKIGDLLSLPVARSEFATGYFNGSVNIVEGILSVNCIPENSQVFTGESLLISNINNYRSDNLADYTVENCLKSLELANVLPPNSWQQSVTGIETGADLFVGYLMLDALCINRDRHYHNWGVMAVDDRLELIPSFDHGLSLGSTDNISYSVDRYASRFKSPFQSRTQQQLSTFSALEIAAQLYPDAANIWQERVKQVTPAQIAAIFDCIPAARITPAATKFAINLIAYNQQKIIDILTKY